MPEIIVSVEADSDDQGAPVLLRERVSESSLASDHYAAQLMERIGWAVVDASETEQDPETRLRRPRVQGETAAPSESAARNLGAPSS